MAKFDKYLLSQLMVLFGFFALVLVMVYWVNRAVVLFDQLIANGHSAIVFLEFSALTMPNVVRLVLPIASFAAAVYVGNRLASDSELVVMQTTGYSPFRLARPVLYFGLIVALMLTILAHVLVPASQSQFRIRQAEIENNATARLLREGTFLHPASGITFYVAEIGADGSMQNMFLTDNREKGRQTTYTARQAVLVHGDQGIKLIMFDGMAQGFDRKSQTLSTTSFSEFVFDIGPLLARNTLFTRRPNEMSTRDLIWPGPDITERPGFDRALFQQLGHERISQALLAIVVALVGFSAILMGGFSRFSLWKQVLIGLLVLIGLKMLDNFMNDLARRAPGNWPFVYLASVVGFIVAMVMLWLSDRPALFMRRRREAPT